MFWRKSGNEFCNREILSHLEPCHMFWKMRTHALWVAETPYCWQLQQVTLCVDARDFQENSNIE